MKKLLLGLIAIPLVVTLPIGCAKQQVSLPLSVPTGQQTQTDDGLRADHPDTYTVVKGDTLWDIANRFLNKPWLWKDLWQMNPSIKNPDLIYPGDIIKIIYVNGKPQLAVDRGLANKNFSNCTNEPTQKVEADGVVKILPQCRALSLESAIPAISLQTIAPFLSENKIATKEEISKAPHVVAGEDGRVVGGEGDIMYARGSFDTNSSTYNICRVGKTYIDPVSKEVLGMEMQVIGKGRVVSPGENISKINLTKTNSEVRIGDILLPEQETKVESVFEPHSPEKIVDGVILNVPNSVSDIGQYDTVLISKGARDGLNPGSVLAIHKKGPFVKDLTTQEFLKMPSDKAGILMVFRTFEKVSYALIMNAERPLAVGDEVKNP